MAKSRTSWKKGQTGNSNGRPMGSRHRLSEHFLSALADDFEAHGKATIATLRVEDPASYVRVVASLMPKEHHVSGVIEHIQQLTDDEIIRRIAELDATTGIAPAEAGSGTAH